MPSTLAFCHKQALQSIRPLINGHWPFLTGLFMSTELSIFLIKLPAESNPHLKESLQLITDLSLLLSDFIVSTTLMLLIPTMIFAYQRNSALTAYNILSKNINLLTIEALRSTAGILRWGILFLIPGAYKYFRYYFVSFIVLFSKDYANGTKDALKESDQLLKQNAWNFFVFLTLLICGQAILTTLLPTHQFEVSFLKTITSDLVQYLYNIYFYAAVYFYFTFLMQSNERDLIEFKN